MNHKTRARLASALVLVLIAVCSVGVLLHAARPPVLVRGPAAERKDLDAPALLKHYCTGCHASGRTHIELDGTPTVAGVQQDAALWQKVAHVLGSEQMPPDGMDGPHPQDRRRMLAWIDESLRTIKSARVAARRLSASEYRNAVRDLLGVDLDLIPARPGASEHGILPIDFPVDETLWALYPEEPTLPVHLTGVYQAAAEGVLNLLEAAGAVNLPAPEALGREIIRVARRAFRRPLSGAETEHLLHYVDEAEHTPQERFRAALHDVLTSPHFLFRVERSPDAGADYDLVPFELASRLAGFLWASVPDEELLADAEAGTLQRRLDFHVARMLADARARAFAPRFASYWLQLDELDKLEHLPSALRRAMRLETERLMAFIFQHDRDVLELLNADYTFVDETMAKHYGIADIRSDEVRRIPLGERQGRGLLAHASVLAMTSHPLVTSPIKRGRWILEKLLGQRVPPPPLSLTVTKMAPAVEPAEGVKEILGRGGASFGCGLYCHAPLAAIGATLEHFGPSGTWRSEQIFVVNLTASPVDATGFSPTGKAIDGAVGLSSYLVDQKEEFLRCLTAKLLTLALGRRLRASDLPRLEQLVESLEDGPSRFTRVVQYVAGSVLFQKGFMESWPIPAAGTHSR